jgi:CHRD domain
MRSTAPATLLGALVAVGVSACGGSGSSSGSGHAAHHSRPSHVYKLTLRGDSAKPPGAPNGTGTAIIAIHGHSEICWRFAHLHGFTGATGAQIHSAKVARAGKSEVSLSAGPRLHHQGCVRVAPPLVAAIVANPNRYYVDVASTRYPGGAVRARL